MWRSDMRIFINLINSYFVYRHYVVLKKYEKLLLVQFCIIMFIIVYKPKYISIEGPIICHKEHICQLASDPGTFNSPVKNNNMWPLYSTRSSWLATLRRFTVSLTQTYSNPTHIWTPRGAYNICCHYGCKTLNRHIAITSSQILISGWMNQSPHDSITDLEPWILQPFVSESYSLTTPPWLNS